MAAAVKSVTHVVLGICNLCLDSQQLRSTPGFMLSPRFAGSMQTFSRRIQRVLQIYEVSKDQQQLNVWLSVRVLPRNRSSEEG